MKKFYAVMNSFGMIFNKTTKQFEPIKASDTNAIFDNKDEANKTREEQASNGYECIVSCVTLG